MSLIFHSPRFPQNHIQKQAWSLLYQVPPFPQVYCHRLFIFLHQFLDFFFPQNYKQLANIAPASGFPMPGNGIIIYARVLGQKNLKSVFSLSQPASDPQTNSLKPTFKIYPRSEHFFLSLLYHTGPCHIRFCLNTGKTSLFLLLPPSGEWSPKNNQSDHSEMYRVTPLQWLSTHSE